MEINLSTIFYAISLIIILDLILIFLIFFNKKKHKIKKEKVEKMDDYVIGKMIEKREFHLKKDIKLFLERFGALKQIFYFDKEAEIKFTDLVEKSHLVIYFTKRLHSLIKYKRIEAMVYLGIIATEDSRKSLEMALKKEKDYSAKLYIINSLVDIRHVESISKIVDIIPNTPSWYREKAQLLLYEYGKDFYEYIVEIKDSNNRDIKEFIIGFAELYLAVDLKDYLIKTISNPEEETFIVHKAVKVLSKVYFTELNDKKYICHSDAYIRGIAIEVLGNNQSKENLIKLISMLGDKGIKRHVSLAISNIIMEKPQYINILISEFNKETNSDVKNDLAEVISNRMEYLILKLSGNKKDVVKNVIKEIMLMGKNSDIIEFLNRNKDIEIENEIISILKNVIKQKPEIKNEFCTYLNERVLKKCNLTKHVSNLEKNEENKDKKVVVFLYFLIFAVFLVFPIIHAIRHRDILLIMPFMEQLKIYVIDFNYYLIYYSIVVNSIYIILLVFSFIGVNKQSKYWNLKKVTFLFKKGIMPSISIIAPAFNEEATIIESANSLLNLKYPDYELIVVNDGSKDNTIQTLIQYFNLEKVDIMVDEKLNTMPIKGIYRNKSMPKLTVVDKVNGGKADSLNTGINISSNDYFCGIDADSLLETDALIKLTSQMIDEEVECPAMGGNIFPINGCSVNKGMITSLKIPKKNIARLQTIEYIRAFMAGRVGWAYLDCLLIISGAFGLFKKDRIIEIGGYLTSSGKYKKDTVGEDMELVVRLSRHMIEKKQKFKINYVFNANCWTEVPESYNILKRQRDRWHRGLIDILTFHKKIIRNPKYGKVGMIAFPYFFIFEMMGPLVEIQGYCMVFLATMLGLLNTKIALLLFISTILMGILISLSSLFIAEKERDYFTIKELAVLILYSFVENFGPRQLISLWRVSGYINSLKKPKGWGKMERKGFLKDSNISLK
ncbi:glycosyltransferase [Romboutsia sp.]|uniref:glycosyltransferase n=1 Tax=Romboutsia sp. TaxID=1965302 RepID=UPI002B5F53AE|nr:glycosyltransferase [Romboutsia sp.]HSQ89288.1 glycosyltransferase [Romboutsia sp.]